MMFYLYCGNTIIDNFLINVNIEIEFILKERRLIMVYDKVQDYIKSNNLSGNSSFEKLCGLGNGTVSGWKDGNPRVETLIKIESATGIPVSKWLQEE